MRDLSNPTALDIKRELRGLEGRDLNREGIPMFLMLEDTDAPPEDGIPSGGRLHTLAGRYFDHLVAHRSRATLEEVATALELLAVNHFDPLDGDEQKSESAAFGDLASGLLVRAINYHNTPRTLAEEVEYQLADAGEKFRSVTEGELAGLLDGHPWPHGRPPLLPVFYEGYRNNYDVALPLLERAGLRGWFFIPTEFIDTPVSEQHSFAQKHDIGLTDDEHGDGRFAMTWDELRDVVARGHTVACHTATHCPVSSIVSDADVHREITAPRRKLEDELGIEARTLAWLYGTPYGENPLADAAVRGAGYHYVFSNTRIQRIPGRT